MQRMTLLRRLLVVATLNLATGTTVRGQQSSFDSPNASGVLRTITRDGSPLDPSNPFFQVLGTNGRACSTCHVPSAGWSLTPAHVRSQFERTRGLGPLFRTNDGSISPLADVSTVAARRAAFRMLLEKALIRVGLPIPAGAEFELVAVDDPYHYAGPDELSLFRHAPPSSNLRFLTTVMWDGRESFAPLGTLPILATNTPQANAFALFADLKHQANDATMGHAQGGPLSDAQMEAIASFELNLVTAQQQDRHAGDLSVRGAQGGPGSLAGVDFYVTINDALGGDVFTHLFDPRAMTLYQAWANSRDPNRAAIARGAEVFNTKSINITGVGGLNDDLNMTVIRGSCTTCHDAPNVGGHSVALPIDIGVTDPEFRTPDLPLYTLRNRATGAVRKTSDPGRALITGRWNDIGKFKGPVLRGLAARPPYFHNGMAADLDAVIDFYDQRFSVGFTDQERADLIAFLNAL